MQTVQTIDASQITDTIPELYFSSLDPTKIMCPVDYLIQLLVGKKEAGLLSSDEEVFLSGLYKIAPDSFVLFPIL